jgi:hypothetical protein
MVLLVRFNNDALECLKVVLFTEHMHPPDRSVEDVVNKPTRCYSRCSRHNTTRYQNGVSLSILAASPFPLSTTVIKERR